MHSSDVRGKSSAIRKTDSTPRGFKVNRWINPSVLWNPLFPFPSDAHPLVEKPDATYVSHGDYFQSFLELLIDYVAERRNGDGLMNDLSSPRCLPRHRQQLLQDYSKNIHCPDETDDRKHDK